MIKIILILCIIQTIMFGVFLAIILLCHDECLTDIEWKKFLIHFNDEQRRLIDVQCNIWSTKRLIESIKYVVDDTHDILIEMQKDINYLWNIAREHERKMNGK